MGKVVAADPVVKGGAECGVGNCEWQQAAIAVVDEGPDWSGDGGDERGPEIGQVDNRKAEAGDEDGPDGLVFRKECEQSTEEAELEKGLLNECPSRVCDEDDEDFPIKDSFGIGRPTGATVGENSANDKEDDDRWNGDPECHLHRVFELVLGLRWRGCCPDNIFCVASGCCDAKERESGQCDIEPGISTREEEQESGGEECEDSKFECDFLADGRENCFHRMNVFWRVNAKALKILEGCIERVYALRGT